MADLAPRSEGFCTETLLIQPRLNGRGSGDPETVEEVCKPHIALADCANLLVKRAIVGRHDSSAVRRIPIQVCAEIQQSESANMTSSLFWVFTWIGTRSAVCPGCCGWSRRNHSQGAGARKADSQSVDFCLNGTYLGPAKLHVTHSKDNRGPESGL